MPEGGDLRPGIVNRPPMPATLLARSFATVEAGALAPDYSGTNAPVLQLVR
jgi:hypothetical protein